MSRHTERALRPVSTRVCIECTGAGRVLITPAPRSATGVHMTYLFRFKPFLFLIVAWLAGLARLHAWAADTEARTARQDEDVIAWSMSSPSEARDIVVPGHARERTRRR